MLAEDGYGLLPLSQANPTELQSFTCGKERLDSFLTDEASTLHGLRLGWTSVVFHRDVGDGPVGYFTLANDSIELSSSEHFTLEIDDSIRRVPAVKIGRFAVSARLQRQGVGRAMMGLIRGEILDAEYLSAARLLTLDADSEPGVVDFYRSLGFVESLWAANKAKGGAPKGRPTIKMLRDVLS